MRSSTSLLSGRGVDNATRGMNAGIPPSCFLGRHISRKGVTSQSESCVPGTSCQCRAAKWLSASLLGKSWRGDETPSKQGGSCGEFGAEHRGLSTMAINVCRPAIQEHMLVDVDCTMLA